MESQNQEYIIDENNKIIETKNVFYEKNLIGLNYFDFADDQMLIKILKEIFIKVRKKNKTFVTTYRCDNEQSIRLFTLEIIPLDSGKIRLIHRLKNETNREIKLNLEKRSDKIYYLCAWCNKIKVGDSFVEIDDAVNKLKILEYNYLPKFSHIMCNDCKDKLLKETEDLN